MGLQDCGEYTRAYRHRNRNYYYIFETKKKRVRYVNNTVASRILETNARVFIIRSNKIVYDQFFFTPINGVILTNNKRNIPTERSNF